ncbi:MAG: hypothetical protein KC657_40000 [Myxococcales bacterium]|nr:hypothetical protein [Myxococcales bacterium]
MRLLAGLGATTPPGEPGSVRISMTPHRGSLELTFSDTSCELTVSWEVALRLISLLHILILQNRLLRNEPAQLTSDGRRKQIFSLTGGEAQHPLRCSWNRAAPGVECAAAAAPDEEVEVVLREDAATELVMALVQRFARNGIAKSPAVRGQDESP